MNRCPGDVLGKKKKKRKPILNPINKTQMNLWIKFGFSREVTVI